MSNKYQPSRLALAIGSALAVSSTDAATITVNTLDDPGGAAQCSLRSAIDAVNLQTAVDGCAAGDGTEDTIVFDSGLTGTLALDAGRLWVSSDLHIEGPGAEQLTIDAQGNHGVLGVGMGAEVSVSGMTITGGSSSYGAGVYVYSQSSLSLSECVITGNHATSLGGGMEVWGDSIVEVADCVMSDNSAGYRGGGISVTRGQALVLTSVISGNEAVELGGGLWVNSNETTVYASAGAEQSRGYDLDRLFIIDSEVSGNQAESGGGVAAGIPSGGDYLESAHLRARPELQDRFHSGSAASFPGDHRRGGYTPPNLVLIGSTISGNSAVYAGGGILLGSDAPASSAPMGAQPHGDASVSAMYALYSTITDNEAVYAGGGIASKYSELVLLESEVSENRAQLIGGGISGYGHATVLYRSELTENEALAGGGAANLGGVGYTYLSTVSGNHGGGLLNKYGTALVEGARIEDNVGSTAGGLNCFQSQCLIVYSSVTGNQGEVVGGIYSAGLDSMPDSDTLSFDQDRGTVSTAYAFVVNSTVSGNSGGLAGGAAFDVPTSVKYATVTDNHQDPDLYSGDKPEWAGRSGGLLIKGEDSQVLHSIIAGNTAEDGPDDLHVPPDFSPTDALSVSWSLIEDTTGFTPAGTGNLFATDPQLQPLELSVSPFLTTRIHPLSPASPAIDAGDPEADPEVDVDQRGPSFPRVMNQRIDIGAFEFWPAMIFRDRFELE